MQPYHNWLCELKSKQVQFLDKMAKSKIKAFKNILWLFFFRNVLKNIEMLQKIISDAGDCHIFYSFVEWYKSKLHSCKSKL